MGRQRLDRRSLNSAKKKGENSLLKMGECCALVQSRCDISRSKYYKVYYPLVKPNTVFVDPEGKGRRIKKAKILELIDEWVTDGHPGAPPA